MFLDGIAQGRLIGNRIASGVDAGRVYFPPRDVSPADGAPSAEYVDLPDTGIVTTFCIVNVPFQGQRIKPPYVVAYVTLGEGPTMMTNIVDADADAIRIGQRVAVRFQPSEGGPPLPVFVPA